MTRRGSLLILVAALLAVTAVLMSGCGQSAHPSASTAPKPTTAAPSVTPTPGPLVVPVDQLVVPEALVPRRGEDASSIEKDIRRAFGPMLTEVSVAATFFPSDEWSDDTYPDDFYVRYRLTDCPVQVSTFLSLLGLTDSSVVPPLTQLQDTPLGRDWMSGERFRELLRAYGAVNSQPCGALESYATARRKNLDDRTPAGQVATIDGKTRPVADLWVVTPGAETQGEFRRLYRQTGTAGYVFSFPTGGKPEYLGSVQGLGAYSVLVY